MWHLICESTGSIATGTHREMWEAWRKLDDAIRSNHFVAYLESGVGISGGTRDTPKGIRSAGMFPGVKKCIRKCTLRTQRQKIRKELQQCKLFSHMMAI